MGATGSITRTYVLEDEMYFHLRPASMLVRELMKFECNVEVSKDGTVANGKSILELAILAAGPGSALTFRLKGKDAPAAAAAVDRLFKEQFKTP